MPVRPGMCVVVLLLADTAVQARRSSLPMDRPLWRLHVIHGYSPDEYTLCYQAHHALQDGMSGMATLRAMMTGVPLRPPRPSGTPGGPCSAAPCGPWTNCASTLPTRAGRHPPTPWFPRCSASSTSTRTPCGTSRALPKPPQRTSPWPLSARRYAKPASRLWCPPTPRLPPRPPANTALEGLAEFAGTDLGRRGAGRQATARMGPLLGRFRNAHGADPDRDPHRTTPDRRHRAPGCFTNFEAGLRQRQGPGPRCPPRRLAPRRRHIRTAPGPWCAADVAGSGPLMACSVPCARPVPSLW